MNSLADIFKQVYTGQNIDYFYIHYKDRIFCHTLYSVLTR